MNDEMQLFVGCALAAHEEASGLCKEMRSSGVRQRVKPMRGNFEEDGSLSSTNMQSRKGNIAQECLEILIRIG